MLPPDRADRRPVDPLEQDNRPAAAGAGLAGRAGARAPARHRPPRARHPLAHRIRSRIALVVGLAAVVISGVLGMAIGLVAGYFGGRLDDFLMRSADVQLAFPFILLAIAIIGVLGPSLRNIIIVIGCRPGWCTRRVVRGECSRSASASTCTRRWRSAAGTGGSWSPTCCPTPSPRGLVVATLDMARVIVIESALSFLGLGVQPPRPPGAACSPMACLPLDRLVAGDVPGSRDPHHRARHQPLRRRPARHARPAAQTLTRGAMDSSGTLVLSGARIIDGTGAEPVRADPWWWRAA